MNTPTGTTFSVKEISLARATILVVLWVLPLIIFLGALKYGWLEIWSAFGVPSYKPPFLDLRVVTSGLTTLHHGGDPLIYNPADPLGRALNYPRIWLLLFSFFHINDGNVIFLGLGICVVYLLCISHLLLHSSSDLEAFVILLAALSLSALFGMERGNIDLLMFGLVYAGSALVKGRVRSVLFAAAAVLKIYPIAALAVDVAQKDKKQRTWPGMLLGMVILILAAQAKDINLIRYGTPVSSVESYGILSINALVIRYADNLGVAVPFALGFRTAAGCLLIGVCAALIAWSKPGELKRIRKEAGRYDLFAVFAAIYAFSFALGSNWDYRLIFLIPTLPLAFQLGRLRIYRHWAVLYIAAVLFSMNSYVLRTEAALLLMHAVFYLIFLFVIVGLVQQLRNEDPPGEPRVAALRDMLRGSSSD